MGDQQGKRTIVRAKGLDDLQINQLIECWWKNQSSARAFDNNIQNNNSNNNNENNNKNNNKQQHSSSAFSSLLGNEIRKNTG